MRKPIFKTVKYSKKDRKIDIKTKIKERKQRIKADLYAALAKEKEKEIPKPRPERVPKGYNPKATHPCSYEYEECEKIIEDI